MPNNNISVDCLNATWDAITSMGYNVQEEKQLPNIYSFVHFSPFPPPPPPRPHLPSTHPHPYFLCLYFVYTQVLSTEFTAFVI